MTREEIFEKGKEIIRENFHINPDKIKPESDFKEDLDLDSLDFVEVIMDIEDTFDIEIDDSKAAGLTTMESMVNLIEQYTKEKI